MMTSKLLSAVVLVGFMSSLSAYVLVNPPTKPITSGQNIPSGQVHPSGRTITSGQTIPFGQTINSGQTKKVVPHQQATARVGRINPTSINTIPGGGFFSRYFSQWTPQRMFPTGSWGRRSQGQRFFPNANMRWLMGLGNERSFLTSMLGTSPYRSYYPGQVVKSSPISPGGGMFINTDGTDGTILNADGSVTSVDGSDVSIDSGF